MIKKRYFKDNKSYFNFLHKNKRIFKIINVKPLKNSIRIDYVKKEAEDIEPEQIELDFIENEPTKIGNVEMIKISEGGTGFIFKN